MRRRFCRLKTEPQFYTFFDVEGERAEALPMFGAIGKYVGGPPPPLPKVEEFCRCDQHVHTIVAIPHKV